MTSPGSATPAMLRLMSDLKAIKQEPPEVGWLAQLGTLAYPGSQLLGSQKLVFRVYVQHAHDLRALELAVGLLSLPRK